MAWRTARIHRVRGRPPLLAAGIQSLIHFHSSSVRSLGYVCSFISLCYTTHEDFSDSLLDLLSLLILTPVTSRNILFLQLLSHSIPYRQYNVRRRKDAHRVGTATRGSLERLSRLPRRLHADGGASGRVRRTLSTRAGDRGQRVPRAPLPPGVAVPSGACTCSHDTGHMWEASSPHPLDNL